MSARSDFLQLRNELMRIQRLMWVPERPIEIEKAILEAADFALEAAKKQPLPKMWIEAPDEHHFHVFKGNTDDASRIWMASFSSRESAQEFIDWKLLNA